MTQQDLDKLKRLDKTFELNFRLTNLYALYLERFPEVISAQMVQALTADGSMSEREAVVAILCELFKLDMDSGEDDRRLIREYVAPSVRILDAEKYESNPYYRLMRGVSAGLGDWELRWEKYPAYRGVVCDDMQIRADFSELAPIGFFKRDFEFLAVLEGGNEWMTLTPVDLDTCEEAIERAHGRVVTFGLGLGYYAFMASEKNEVESVTVVEKSREVIQLFKNHLLPRFPHADKIYIVEADAFEYAERVMPSEAFDVAFVDTWRDASDGAPMHARMKQLEPLCPNTEFIYWIERFLISRHRALRYAELRAKIDEGAEDAPGSYGELTSALSDPLGIIRR